MSAAVGLSPELRMMFAPERTYTEIAGEHSSDGFLVAVRRPAFVALITGTALATAATSILPARLLLSMVVSWSFAPLVQMMAAAAVVASVPRREIRMGRAIDLLFVGHAPWSLWLLTFGAAAAWGPGDIVSAAAFGSFPIPVVWTAWIIRGFCRTVLHTTPRGALLRTALHQGIIWSVAAVYIITAISWARLIPILQR